MRLSDILGHVSTTTFTQISLVIFFTSFVGILIMTLRPGARAEQQRARELPLEEDGPDA